MNITQLLKGYNYRIIHAAAHESITGIQYDSRLVEKGNLFVAIKGYQVDGHDYIEKAINLGARAILCSDLGKIAHMMDQYESVEWLFVEDTRNALAYVSNLFFNKPSRELALIGITGTNGKTSISQLLSDMLEGLNKKTGVIGTIGNKVGAKVYETAVTTPESLNLNKMFKDMVSEQTDACLMEVSSHSLALDRVAYLNYNIGIFTNLTQDHLDFHRDFEEYYSAKRRLFLMTDTYNLVNGDDPFGRRLLKDMEALKVKAKTITYGIDQEADIMARNVSYSVNGVTYDLCTAEFTVGVQVAMPGKIYVYNTLAAIGALILMGASKEDVLKAVDNIKAVPGRFEKVDSPVDVHVIVDYAHAPDALQNVLSIAKEFTVGRLIVVFGCGGDRDKSKRPLMGQIALEGADYVVVTSDNPRTEVASDIIKDIIKTYPHSGSYRVIEDRKEAIEEAIAMATSGDTVVIAGKGHETYQIVGTEKVDFDDRLIAKEALALKGDL